MSCNKRYWESQSCATPDRPRNPVLASEAAQRLAAIQQERAAQDARWNYAAGGEADSQVSTGQTAARCASAKSK